MDHDQIEHLRRHPAWSLLRANTVALVVGFLTSEFIDHNAGNVHPRPVAWSWSRSSSWGSDRRVEPVAVTHPSVDSSPLAELPSMLAAVDIGTNSVHMVVARVSGRTRFEVVTRHKEVVRLGSGADDMRQLTPDAIERGIAALTRCRQLADSFDAELTAVATSAVREADNAAEFLRRAWVEAGVRVDVIGGLEEARLIHLGVLQALAVFDKAVMLCDVGGGSTELLHAEGDTVLASRSFKLGSIRMTERFFPEGVITAAAIKEARRHVRGTIALYRRETKVLPIDCFVVTSGTAECLMRMALLRDGGDLPTTMNGAVVPRATFTAAVADVLAAKLPEERAALAGMDRDRADIIAGGAVVLDEVMAAYGVTEVTFADAALREGVLLDTLQRLTGDDLSHLSQLRRQSVLHLLELCYDDPEHAVHVARLAGILFDGLRRTLGLRRKAGEILEAAALLANVGLFISHSRHHQHSYYVIRNSEHLTGFTDHEIELIAQVARYHRKSAPTDRHPAFAALDEDDRALVTALAALLRIAIGLDRGHAGRVGQVEVSVDDEAISLTVVPVAPGEDLDVEAHSAGERTALLETASGRRVDVVVGISN